MGFKTFSESWSTDTATGRAVDKATGGRLSAQANKNAAARSAAVRGVNAMNAPSRTAKSGTGGPKGPGASMAAAKASPTAKANASPKSAVQSSTHSKTTTLAPGRTPRSNFGSGSPVNATKGGGTSVHSKTTTQKANSAAVRSGGASNVKYRKGGMVRK